MSSTSPPSTHTLTLPCGPDTYSILTYHRLGVGQSSEPDALFVRCPLQVPVPCRPMGSRTFTRLTSAGDLLKIARVTGDDRSLALSPYPTHPDRPCRPQLHMYGSFAHDPTASLSWPAIL